MSQHFSGRKAMGAIGSPVFLITSAHESRRGIMTANMVAGISFDPPLVAVSLSNHSFTKSLIDESGEFALNIVPPELMALVKEVGSSSGRKTDKFLKFSIETIPGDATGCPLLKDAITSLECKVKSTTDVGKHSLYVGTVAAYHDINPGRPLYLYHGRYYSIGEEFGKFKEDTDANTLRPF